MSTGSNETAPVIGTGTQSTLSSLRYAVQVKSPESAGGSVLST